MLALLCGCMGPPSRRCSLVDAFQTHFIFNQAVTRASAIGLNPLGNTDADNLLHSTWWKVIAAR